ncbi:MAG: NAD-dependent epimerase/dehydratase family protein, partial [Verrucomicrobiota bacterium]
MKAFVTGASGFIGSNLVHELVAQGHRVKALLRLASDKRGLVGVEFEHVTGDVFDHKLLEREMEGCDWCFHVAASYHLWLRDYKPMYDVNVEGTRNVLEAAGKVGCRRIVYTSTVGCIGLPKMVNGRFTPTTELDTIANEQLTNHYKCSKWQAECLAVKLVKNGLPIVIVNPT